MKKLLITAIFLILIIPILSFALENQYDGLVSEQTNDLFVYFVKIAISAGVIIAVFVIMYHGINMIIAQGEMAKIIIAKERIQAVFVGLIILLGVYVIASTINPDLVIMNIRPLEYVAEVFNRDNKNTNPNVLEFEEIPLGTIVETILAANSSKRLDPEKKDVTEELCYSYDENGDTIDRNGDGKITEDDTLRGVDMFYCIEELNQAIIKKVKALNADYLCKGKLTDGPMRRILDSIKSIDDSGENNCRCSRCASWSYLDQSISYACQTKKDSCETCDPDGNCQYVDVNICDSNCFCCGSAYYKPNFGCQISSFLNTTNDHDPCVKDVRDQIDCDRNEIKIRVDGESYKDLPPGAKADMCPFTAFWEDPNTDKEKFLTLNLAIKRMETFEEYYKNHLEDLDRAIIKMRDPYGERISMAEFHSLQNKDNQGKKIVEKSFVGSHGKYVYTYDPVRFCRDFNCTVINNNNCFSGKRAELTSFLYAEELKNDPCVAENGNCNVYNSEKENYEELKEKRICNVETNKESYSYAGDGATFYYRQGFKYEESYSKETLRMITDKDKKGYMVSEIPLGELVNDAKLFADKLLEFTGTIKKEIESVKEKAQEFADLPEQCDCSRCTTYPTDGGEKSCDKVGACPTDNYCDDCSSCDSSKEKQCICCEECELVDVIDKVSYDCLISESPQWPNNYGLRLSPPWEYFAAEPSVVNKFQTYFVPVDGVLYNNNYVEYYLGREFKSNFPCDKMLYASPKIRAPEICTEWDYSYKTCLVLRKRYDNSGMLYLPIIKNNQYYLGEPTGCNVNDVFKRFWKKEDPCYSSIAIHLYDFDIFPSVYGSHGSYFEVGSCKNISNYSDTFDSYKSIIKYEPNFTTEEIYCEEEIKTTQIEEKDREIIENHLKSIRYPVTKWTSEETFNIDRSYCDRLLHWWTQTKTLYTDYLKKITQQRLYNAGDSLTLPPGYTGYYIGKNEVKVTKTIGTSSNYCLDERGQSIKKDYYVCPYDDLKNQQCMIFNYSRTAENYDYPEDPKYQAGIDCRDNSYCSKSGNNKIALGHLQKIELLARRIDSYGKGENLKAEDPNRWTILDTLNYSRKKLDQCVTGYGLPLKQGTKSYTLLSCEEGLDTLAFGSATILPAFPYPPSDIMWNCQPYNNMNYLTPGQREACLNNKQHPICTNAIYSLVDDYYCLQR